MKTTSCGNFSPDGKEFILTNPLLDRPWMNVLSNGRWCYVASHLGGGYSFLDNPTVGRITRWHIDGVPRDSNGKLLFLRDEEQPDDWWCANGYPPTRKLDEWACHIGLGYNTIRSRKGAIESEMTWFTPMPDAASSSGEDVGDPCLLWLVKLTNHGDRPKTITATPFVELALGNWHEDTSWREFYILFNRQEFKDNTLFTRSTQWVKYIGGWQAANSDANNIPFDHAVFLTSSEKVESYEGDRYEFVGSYRDLTSPRAMDAAALRGKVGEGRDACAAVRHKFTIPPGESVEFVLMLGAVPREARNAKNLTGKYLTVAKAKKALDNCKAYWENVCSTPHIETPDNDFDCLINYWFKYQGANLSWWNRNTGYCYFGIYNFGVRDACQDTASRLPQDPKWVRDHIVKRIMIWQFEDGDYAHGGNFVSMTGTRTFHSDDPINPLFILARYVRETGDFSILKEKTEYAHTNGKKKDTVYAHIIKGMDYFFRMFSKRGLPLILKADWNDALDQVGNQKKGDSVMLGFWAIYCLEQFYPCMEHMKDTRKLGEFKRRLTRLKKVLNEVTWDGNWYQRAMHDDGTLLGTRSSKYGKIWANPNSFAIVSDVAPPDRVRKILKSFDKYLDHELGSYTFFPPFAEPEPRAGIISRFYPGTKENGAIFGHSSRWRIWAECHAGRGDKAYEIFDKMSPIRRHEADPELYRIEPYAACQFIYAPESGRPGEGSHSWATGTACWSLINAWEHILGVTAELDGLKINPCLPSKWTWAKMTRDYRGDRYLIEIRKKPGIQKGRVKIELDGEPIKGQVIPPCNDGRVHTVIVNVS
ncbi:MAG: hypothetical protein JJU36_02930 [Phycisphaeraceae bacterium]|nr:hypothetical protein [Phycisphaeraceae bacterium]